MSGNIFDYTILDVSFRDVPVNVTVEARLEGILRVDPRDASGNPARIGESVGCFSTLDYVCVIWDPEVDTIPLGAEHLEFLISQKPWAQGRWRLHDGGPMSVDITPPSVLSFVIDSDAGRPLGIHLGGGALSMRARFEGRAEQIEVKAIDDRFEYRASSEADSLWIRWGWPAKANWGDQRFAPVPTHLVFGPTG